VASLLRTLAWGPPTLVSFTTLGVVSVAVRLCCLGVRSRRVPPFVGCAVLALCSASVSSARVSRWVIQPVPKPVGLSDPALAGVSCPVKRWCVAVGGPDGSRGHVLVERWDGSRWSILRTPQPTGRPYSFLNDVSCSSKSACTGVGYSNDRSNATSSVLVERWNGSRWSIQRTPKVSGADSSVLIGVSCTSRTACTAVGDWWTTAGYGGVLIEHWNGSSWTIQDASEFLQNVTMNNVSCASDTACIAVGVEGPEPYATEARWDGMNWTFDDMTLLQPEKGSSTWHAVSCASTTFCFAVGSEYEYHRERVLVHDRACAGDLPDPELYRTQSWSRSTPS
jgi:photosystem II stability/assembly factor-like uncharacterized protein